MDKLGKYRYDAYLEGLNDGSKSNLESLTYVIYPSEIHAGLHKDNILAGFDIASTPGNDLLSEKWERQKLIALAPGGGVLTAQLRSGQLPSTMYYGGDNNPYIQDDTFVGDRVDSINRRLITNRQKRMTLEDIKEAKLVKEAEEAYADLIRAHQNLGRNPSDPIRVRESSGAELAYFRKFYALPQNRGLIRPPIPTQGDEDIALPPDPSRPIAPPLPPTAASANTFNSAIRSSVIGRDAVGTRARETAADDVRELELIGADLGGLTQSAREQAVKRELEELSPLGSGLGRKKNQKTQKTKLKKFKKFNRRSRHCDSKLKSKSKCKCVVGGSTAIEKRCRVPMVISQGVPYYLP